MATFNEVLRELEAGKTIELKYDLGNKHFSTHELSLDKGMIYDFCQVDYSTTVNTIKEFKYGFYCTTFKYDISKYDESNA